MAMETRWAVDASQIEAVQQAVADFGDGYGRAIDRALHSPKLTSHVCRQIDARMPASGRVWRGKAPQAKGAPWPKLQWGDMSLTVTTHKRYAYLYFPDDGSQTRRHRGGQAFFAKGGEEALPEVARLVAASLAKEMEDKL